MQSKENHFYLLVRRVKIQSDVLDHKPRQTIIPAWNITREIWGKHINLGGNSKHLATLHCLFMPVHPCQGGSPELCNEKLFFKYMYMHICTGARATFRTTLVAFWTVSKDLLSIVNMTHASSTKARVHPGLPRIGPRYQKKKIRPPRATQSCMNGVQCWILGSMLSGGLAGWAIFVSRTENAGI